jgi:outer membrane protein
MRLKACLHGSLPALAGIAAALAINSLAAIAPATAQIADGDAPINTLTEALAAAYYNNATLQAQRAALRQADEDVPAAISGWRPTVELTGTAGRVVGQETDNIPGINAPESINQNRNEALGEVTLTQPIYNGGKTIDATRQAKNTVYAQRAALLAQEQTVFLDVVTDYVTVISDTHLLALDENNVTVLKQQLQATDDQFNVGDITLTSVAQAQAALAQAREQVSIAVGDLQIAKENFRHDVGQYPGDLTAPQPLSLPVTSKDEAGASAQSNNPNVIAAEFNNAADKDAIDVAFSALLPQVSLQASSRFTRAGRNIPPSGRPAPRRSKALPTSSMPSAPPMRRRPRPGRGWWRARPPCSAPTRKSRPMRSH